MSRPWMHSRTGGTELRASRSGRDHGHHSERLSQGEAAAILTLSSSHKPAFLLGITAAGSTRCCTHCAETTSIYLHALCHHSQPGADTRGDLSRHRPHQRELSSRSPPAATLWIISHLALFRLGWEDTRGWIHPGSESHEPAALAPPRLGASTKPGSHRGGGLPSSDRSGDAKPPLSLCSAAAGTKSAVFTASLQVPKPR